MEIPSQTFYAQKVTVGEFELPKNLIDQIGNEEKLSVSGEKISLRHQKGVHVVGDAIYIGYDPTNPQIGDLKISYTIIRSPQKVSIVAKQQDNSLVAYRTKTNTSIMMLSMGIVPADQMFQQAQEGNVTRTWLVRLLGFLLMFIGITLIFKPIVTFGDVIPIIGSILNFGIGAFAFIVALALSLVVIAIAWIAARPILGIALLVIGVGSFVAFKVLGQKKRSSTATS
ncbi:MAG: TMEM43 family protein, partial [Spirochaetes bacterium]|nr:TMEM43 family protein [Spirochaetota bacterium]